MSRYVEIGVFLSSSRTKPIWDPGLGIWQFFRALENGMGGNEAGFEEYIPNQEKQTFWDTFASSKTPQIFEITTLGYNSDQKCIPNQENEPFGIHSPP